MWPVFLIGEKRPPFGSYSYTTPKFQKNYKIFIFCIFDKKHKNHNENRYLSTKTKNF